MMGLINLIIILMIFNDPVVNSIPFGGGGDSGDGYGYDGDDLVQTQVINNGTDFDSSQNGGGENDRVIKTILNMSDEQTQKILERFNVTREKVLSRKEQIFPERISTTSQQNSSNDDQTISLENYRTKFMLEKIAGSINRSPELQPPPAIHEVAFYPVCSKNNETSWSANNTAKLYFSSTLFNKLEPNTNIISAKLRLRQIDESNGSHDRSNNNNDCTEPEELIHVTVSTYVKRPSGVKKHICQTISISRYHTGWIEFNVRHVINQWEKSYRNNNSRNGGGIGNTPDPMLAIDVVDQNSNALKAGLFFEPTDCQAYAAIPFSLYADIRDLPESRTMPFYPRLDISYSRQSNSYSLPSMAMQQQQQQQQQYHRHSIQNRLERLREIQPSVVQPISDQSTHQFMSGQWPISRRSTSSSSSASSSSASPSSSSSSPSLNSNRCHRRHNHKNRQHRRHHHHHHAISSEDSDISSGHE